MEYALKNEDVSTFAVNHVAQTVGKWQVPFRKVYTW